MSLLLRHPRLFYGTCLLVLAATANGADNSDASRFRVMPYLWGAQFDGTLGAGSGGPGDGIDIDLGFGVNKEGAGRLTLQIAAGMRMSGKQPQVFKFGHG